MTAGTDLLIAGAGGGLVGALRAVELGCTPVVVEVSEHFARANNTAMSTAMVLGAGTDYQRAAGIDDDPELLLADIMRKTQDEADPVLARALAEVSPRLVGWLTGVAGLPMELVTDFDYPGHSRPRCHSLPGRSGNRLLAALLAACRDRGIDVLVPARLVDVDVDGGAVRAGLVEYPDGRREEIPARAVLLATNGFGADADLVRRHIPQIAGATYHGSDASRGDALRIGTSRGADTAFLDAYQGHAALARRAATLVGWATVMHGAFLVNVDGRRFGDETEGYSEYAARELAQRGGEAVIVLDRRVHDACLAFDDFRETVQAGVLRWADSPGELAAAVDVDSAGLAGTLAEAAAAANGEAADPFGRTHWPAPLEPPYAAVRVVPAVFHTQGGLRVDGHARVLTGSGDTAAGGLYASGGAAMGISGHGAAGYLAGNGLLPALGLALLAAEDAAGTRR